MSKQDGLFTDGADNFAPRADSIPLSDVDTSTSQQSIGTLVSNATAQMSSLFRSELELAKTELAGEAKKGAVGGGFFGVAAAIALYSSFFFFFFVAALIAVWLPWWAAFLIVLVVMLAVAAVFALLGWRNMKKLGAPKKTIDSVSELKDLVPGKAQDKLQDRSQGMYS